MSDRSLTETSMSARSGADWARSGVDRVRTGADRARTAAAAVQDRLARRGWKATVQEVAGRSAQALAERLAPGGPELPLRPDDVHFGRVSEPAAPAVGSWSSASQSGPGPAPLRIGWVCTPPGGGSGGHTTLFRMVAALEARGHRCSLVLYDRNSDEVARHGAVIRRHWPDLTAEIVGIADGLDSFDVVVASSWPTAHLVAARAGSAVPCYFIQDYEPYFHPYGYLYELAESTYRMGLRTIALGEMVATEMRGRAGVEPDAVVPFGTDTDTYRLLDGGASPEHVSAPATLPASSSAAPASASPTPARRGVVFYAKRSADRRGYLLAVEALRRFHRLRPDEPIHIVGDALRDPGFPAVEHGSLTPAQLNALYNRVTAGLAMSFTNVSLVPGELLAAGVVPVLNDHPGPRLDLDSPHAVWAEGSPDGLAEALARAVDHPDPDARARRIAAEPRESWARTQALVGDFLEDVAAARTGVAAGVAVPAASAASPVLTRSSR